MEASQQIAQLQKQVEALQAMVQYPQRATRPNRIYRLEDMPSDPNKFDLRTHFFDSNGHLYKTNHYVCHTIDKVSYYERPVSSGNLWLENNRPGGRLVRTFNKETKRWDKTIDATAEHIEMAPELSDAQKIQLELQIERDKNAKLQAELAQIHKESEPPLAKIAAPATKPPLTAKG